MDRNVVNYIDLVTEGTVDEEIVKNLQAKHEIASHLLGDKIRQWLS